jgi:hypothetical protein
LCHSAPTAIQWFIEPIRNLVSENYVRLFRKTLNKHIND